MQFVNFTVKTTRDAEELIADIMWDLGSGGVSIYDSADVAEMMRSSVIWDYIDEKLLIQSDVVSVCGFFPETEREEIRHTLLDRLETLKESCEFALGSLEITESLCDDEDWLVTWKSFYSPLTCGRVRVLPCWINEEDTGLAVVKIDPGTAFGTGEHETTQLMLEGLSETLKDGDLVLDVGTGSGILAIAAKKLGAGEVFAYDIDPMAIVNARENATINGVASDIVLTDEDLLSHSEIMADVVVANITADILIMLSEGIAAHIKAGGTLLLSGIIHKKVEDVRACFSALGFREIGHAVRGEWNALRFVYKA